MHLWYEHVRGPRIMERGGRGAPESCVSVHRWSTAVKQDESKVNALMTWLDTRAKTIVFAQRRAVHVYTTYNS